MDNFKIPGFIYSLLAAIGAWGIEYLSTGPGMGLPWAPIMLMVIPTVLKLLVVASAKDDVPNARGEVQSSSKMKRFLLG